MSNEQEKVTQPDPSPKKEKKVLTPEEQQRRRKMIAMPIFFVVFALCIWWIFAPSKKEAEQAQHTAGFNVNVPDPSQGDLYEDKEAAYLQEDLDNSRRDRMQTLQQFTDQLLQVNEPQVNIQVADKKAPDANIQRSTDAYRESAEMLSNFYQPTKEQENQALLKKVDELMQRVEAAESAQSDLDRNEAMMERSYEMASRYLNTGIHEKEEVVEDPEREILSVRGVGDNTTSSLDGGMTDRQFLEGMAGERNFGFNTAVGSSYRVSRNTFAACIAEEQTVVNGQRVKMRLLEPMQAGKMLIPANSHVTGVANIQNERLDITIYNIEYAGNILPVELYVHDTDGQLGIYAPNSEARSAAKEAVAGMGEGVGTTVSLSTSAGQQAAMDLTRGAIQGTTRLFSSQVRQVKITLKAGYRVLLVAKED